MKQSPTIVISLLLSFCFFAVALAQTPISGPLSGILPVDEYLVTGDISVLAGDSLTILPGTDFFLQPYINFTIQGHLNAVGTLTQTIRFRRANETTPWGHIVFDYNSSDLSNMDYCHIEGGLSPSGTWPYNCGGGILVHGPDVTISNCTITGNQAAYCGGGMAFYSGGDATIINCTIDDNMTNDDGGAVEVYGSAPHFINCVFRDNDAETSMGVGGGVASGEGGMSIFTNCSFIENRAYIGGGYYCDRSQDVVFENCIFENNYAFFYGGGLFFYEDGWGAEFNECLITNNTAGRNGGGIYSAVSEQFIKNCTIVGNSADEGSAIFVNGSDAVVKNCIIEGNTGSPGIHFDYTFYGSVEYNDFHNNSEGNFSGRTPERIGVITGININGTPCDDYMNILEDPLFVDPVNGDYHLTAASECIDAGDPASPLDPDSTIADMGAFYFDQSGGSPVTVILTPENPPIIIPPAGGNFSFNIEVVNGDSTTASFDLWTMVLMPDSSLYGPIILVSNYTLPPNQSANRDRNQRVPGNAPAGNYQYKACIGEYPDNIWSEDWFEFEKVE